EPEVSRQGNNIIIDLPGVKDRERAIDIVGKTAELRFRPVVQENLPPENTEVTTTTTTVPGATTTTAAGATTTTAKATTSSTVQKGSVVEGQATTTSAPASSSTTATTAPANTTTPTTAPAGLTGKIPTTPEDQDTPDKPVVLPIRKESADQGASRLALGPALMTGKDVKSADARYESGQGWVVHLSFTGAGFDTFNKIAAQYVGKKIAIVL